MPIRKIRLPASLQAELKAVSSEEISMNQWILLDVAEKLAARRAYRQFASNDLSALKNRLVPHSRERLRADFDKLMNERQGEISVTRAALSRAREAVELMRER